MSRQPHYYRLNADDALTRVLDQANVDKRPVIIETPDHRYHVIDEANALGETDDPWASYDPDKTIAAIQASAGALKGIDTDAFLKEIYEAREQDTPGRPA